MCDHLLHINIVLFVISFAISFVFGLIVWIASNQNWHSFKSFYTDVKLSNYSIGYWVSSELMGCCKNQSFWLLYLCSYNWLYVVLDAEPCLLKVFGEVLWHLLFVVSFSCIWLLYIGWELYLPSHSQLLWCEDYQRAVMCWLSG